MAEQKLVPFEPIIMYASHEQLEDTADLREVLQAAFESWSKR